MSFEQRLYPTNANRLLADKLLLHQWLLNYQLSIIHAGVSSYQLVCQYLIASASHEELLKKTITIDWILGIASWIIWINLFRCRDRIFCFYRPNLSYEAAVYIGAFISTIPNLVLHIAIIYLSTRMKGDSTKGYNIATAIAAFITLLPLHVFFLWMVHKYLLLDVDSNYEPVVQEFYSDQPSASPSEDPQTFDGPLSATYISQFDHNAFQNDPITDSIINVPSQASGAVDSSASTLHVASVGENRVLKCKSLAHFDYMPQTYIGPGSWTSRAVVSTAFATLSGMVLWVLIKQIHANNKEPRVSSP